MSQDTPTESDARDAGHAPLSGAELKTLLVGTTAEGIFRGDYRFRMYVGPDYAVEGKNHTGTHDFGECTFDDQAGTITARWQNSWGISTTRAFRINGEVRFFDVTTGAWTHTFLTFERGRQPLDVAAP